MEVRFVDTGYISKIKIRDEAVNFDLTNLNSENIVTIIKIIIRR